MHKNILTTIGTPECLELSYNTSKPVKHKSYFHFYPPLVFLLVQEKHSEREKSCSFIFTHLPYQLEQLPRVVPNWDRLLIKNNKYNANLIQWLCPCRVPLCRAPSPVVHPLAVPILPVYNI